MVSSRVCTLYAADHISFYCLSTRAMHNWRCYTNCSSSLMEDFDARKAAPVKKKCTFFFFSLHNRCHLWTAGCRGTPYLMKNGFSQSQCSTLQTTLHFQHRHIFFYCLSTRGNSQLLIALLMTILLSCKITMPKNRQLLPQKNATFFNLHVSLEAKQYFFRQHNHFTALGGILTHPYPCWRKYWPSTSNIGVICPRVRWMERRFQREKWEFGENLEMLCQVEERRKQWLSFTLEGAPKKIHLVNH